MALAAFDTLKFTKRLKSVGVPLEHAEAEAEVLAEIFEVNLRDLATKEDLQREISGLEQRLDVKLEKAKFELLRWMMGFAISIVVLLLGILWKVMTIPGTH